ncbi:sulfotransferase 1B1-like [Paramacrobiotus metropolitanus]|uniref:sulfotransferase 1B1-like n=1 Tax=Paramacrobiotus metropolitanus TaxID=2943436 RepID=UPI002445B981|nr:sulfotransferase 1B1-like [Paramacrobiotus metropolitanus]
MSLAKVLEQPAVIPCTPPVTPTPTPPAISAFKYKFGDEGYLLDYHGTRVMYPMYESLPVVERFEADKKDICIVTFPKSGTHFMGAIVWMILHDGEPSSLLEGDVLDGKVPWLEYSMPGMKANMLPAHTMTGQEGPRVFFTHLGYNALPESIKTQAKVIYVARNPKDVIVSANYFFRALTFTGCSHTMEETIQSFKNNTCVYAPYFDHVAGYRRKVSDMTNLFFATYEEMVQNLENAVKGVAGFLGKQLTDAQIANIVRYCSHAEMKVNGVTSHIHLHKLGLMDFNIAPFMRKGIIGDWKEHFSPELNRQVDEWIEQEEDRVQHDLKGFRFQYEA